VAILLGAVAECKPSEVSGSESPCVEDEALFALARGDLHGVELARAETHLKDCADCRAVLAEAARAFDSGTEAAAPPRIARYEITALVGAGASGVVYRAFDPQLKRQVALKLLRPELHGTSPEQSERMLREAQAMARLSDPHVVAVYDVGLHAGSVYLVMEYIDGSTLTRWLRAEKRDLVEILRVFSDAGQGLAAAHAKGLVHRDFKPENVLVGSDGRAKVTDFGLARESEAWLRDREGDDQASTELYAPTRGLVGTPAYMAPELFEGGRASAASDQFALSVALFVALFERHPFRAGEGIALSELVTRVRAGTLLQPTLTRPEDERLLAVLRRGLAPTPGARFEDVPSLLSALATAVGTPRRLVRWRGVAAAAVLGTLIVGLARTAAKPDEPGPVVPVARLGRQDLREVRSSAPTLAVPLPSTLPEPASVKTVSPSVAPAASERRRPTKPAEVRYKDWLKDPF